MKAVLVFIAVVLGIFVIAAHKLLWAFAEEHETLATGILAVLAAVITAAAISRASTRNANAVLAASERNAVAARESAKASAGNIERQIQHAANMAQQDRRATWLNNRVNECHELRNLVEALKAEIQVVHDEAQEIIEQRHLEKVIDEIKASGRTVPIPDINFNFHTAVFEANIALLSIMPNHLANQLVRYFVVIRRVNRVHQLLSEELKQYQRIEYLLANLSILSENIAALIPQTESLLIHADSLCQLQSRMIATANHFLHDDDRPLPSVAEFIDKLGQKDVAGD